MKSLTLFALAFLPVTLFAATPPEPKFRTVEVDTKVEIGYGVTTADVDGDGKLDILLADKNLIVWYRNPTWEKFVIAEKLTERDHVCIAAADIDGDGKAEIAVGAEWNPGDTTGSGAVFYLIPPADRTQKWESVKLHHEPTTHRMRWVKNRDGKFDLIVVPLHGRGNQNGNGEGVKVMAYRPPANPRDPWKTEVINDALHLTHNFDPVSWSRQPGDEILLGGKEGVFYVSPQGAGWKNQQLIGNAAGESAFVGAGEVRAGKFKGGFYIATIEPMHGNQLAFYTAPDANAAGSLWKRKVLDDALADGHALACGDLLGVGSDQIIVGWRAMNRPGVKVGVKVLTPLDDKGGEWRTTLVDDNTMACEDLCLADLNADGKLDIIAAGRATKNLKIYFNETPR